MRQAPSGCWQPAIGLTQNWIRCTAGRWLVFEPGRYAKQEDQMVERLKPEDRAAGLNDLPGWHMCEDREAISKSFKFHNL